MEVIAKQNYCTVNQGENPEKENWCLSCKFNKLTEVSVRLNDGKEYKYLSRFPVDVDDVAVIGNQYPAVSGYEYGPMATTGQFGSVTDKKEKVEIKRNHAAELDFVFKKSADKQSLKDCSKYLLLNDYFKTLQLSQNFSPIRPITHFTRRILAACSILANQSVADQKIVQIAEEALKTTPVLEEKVSELWYCNCAVQIDLNQVFLSGVENVNDLPEIKDKGYKREEAMLGDFGIGGAKFIADPTIQAYIAKYSYIAAVSIMVRGGFVNMLSVFFEQNPSAADYLGSVKDLLCANGNQAAVSLVKEYLK